MGGTKRKSGQGTGPAASKAKAAKPDDIALKYPHVRKVTTWFFGQLILGLDHFKPSVLFGVMIDYALEFSQVARCGGASWRARQIPGKEVLHTGDM